ncbi:MAG TPA: hypothetical protein VFB89_10085 [Gemmatimonadales bacterium]|nr:hypothetical protein [Gemmatimonadales bacterium]
MAHPEVKRAWAVAQRLGGSVSRLVRRATGDRRPLGGMASAPQAATLSQPVIPLTSLRRSLGRAAVACENQNVCGGVIELALYEHSASSSDVGETSVTEATMLQQTCECDLSEEERERVVDRVQQAIRMRG